MNYTAIALPKEVIYFPLVGDIKNQTQHPSLEELKAWVEQFGVEFEKDFAPYGNRIIAKATNTIFDSEYVVIRHEDTFIVSHKDVFFKDYTTNYYIPVMSEKLPEWLKEKFTALLQKAIKNITL